MKTLRHADGTWIGMFFKDDVTDQSGLTLDEKILNHVTNNLEQISGIMWGGLNEAHSCDVELIDNELHITGDEDAIVIQIWDINPTEL